MFPEDLKFETNRWLHSSAELSDVIITSRIRLARNLQDIPFTKWALPDDLSAVVVRFRNAKTSIEELSELSLIEFPILERLEKDFLRERQIISKEFSESARESLLALNQQETISIMVNEEDHFRIQMIEPGLNLQDAWTKLNQIDDALEKRLRFAFDEEWGYLTACPTNVGTGLRCSTLLHLPCMVLAHQINKVLAAAGQLGLTVRGFHGEGSDNTGNLFQISNQITLGSSEEQIIKNVEAISIQLAENERQIQNSLAEQANTMIEDRVWRAYGVLTNARVISTSESLERLSDIRLGIRLGMIESLPLNELNELLIYVQPAHLQKQAGRPMESQERDLYRAKLIRDRLTKREA